MPTLPTAKPAPTKPQSHFSRGPISPADLPSYRKNRAFVWAVSVGIIAATGALLGAGLKTWRQDTLAEADKQNVGTSEDVGGLGAEKIGAGSGSVVVERFGVDGLARNSVESEPATVGRGGDSLATAAATTAATAAAKITEKTTPTSTPTAQNPEEIKTQLRDIDRSITTLQNRRGALVQRRMQEEGRLRGLKERIVERQRLDKLRGRVGDVGARSGLTEAMVAAEEERDGR